MEFRNKTTDYATMGKKGNVIYWDAIDDLCERFTRELLDFSVPEVDVDDDASLEHISGAQGSHMNVWLRL